MKTHCPNCKKWLEDKCLCPCGWEPKIPGLNAPMTSGQKWALTFAIVAALANLIFFIILWLSRHE
jgi:hypothetical protein